MWSCSVGVARTGLQLLMLAVHDEDLEYDEAGDASVHN